MKIYIAESSEFPSHTLIHGLKNNESFDRWLDDNDLNEFDLVMHAEIFKAYSNNFDGVGFSKADQNLLSLMHIREGFIDKNFSNYRTGLSNFLYHIEVPKACAIVENDGGVGEVFYVTNKHRDEISKYIELENKNKQEILKKIQNERESYVRKEKLNAADEENIRQAFSLLETRCKEEYLKLEHSLIYLKRDKPRVPAKLDGIVLFGSLTDKKNQKIYNQEIAQYRTIVMKVVNDYRSKLNEIGSSIKVSLTCNSTQVEFVWSNSAYQYGEFKRLDEKLNGVGNWVYGYCQKCNVKHKVDLQFEPKFIVSSDVDYMMLATKAINNTFEDVSWWRWI